MYDKVVLVFSYRFTKFDVSVSEDTLVPVSK